MAEAAHDAFRRGDIEQGKLLFRQAADLEAQALAALDPTKVRTLGITAVSTAALWYKAGEFQEAARAAHSASVIPSLPSFAMEELRSLLQAVWNEDARRDAGVSFVPGQVLVSVKGGDIVTGGAPLDLILEKVQTVQSLFYRTAEFLKAAPLRKKGPPSKDLQERCRPWLFQSVPGSYQFAVAIQKPLQTDMFPTVDPEPEVLTSTFLSILKAASEDPDEGLKKIVDKEDYRQTFLKMTRNLAPTGKTFDRMEISGVGDREPVVLHPGSRKIISDSLRGPVTNPASQQKAMQYYSRVFYVLSIWIEIGLK